MAHLRKIVLLLLVNVLIGSPWPGYCGPKRDVNLNERLLQEAQKGKYENVQKLLNMGADVNARGKYNETALVLALLQGDTRLVELLLSKGADVNAKNDIQETPLILATDDKNVAMVKLLLAHGADVNSKRYDGATPLMIASRHADLETVRLLLVAGANSKEKDGAGRTALDYTNIFAVSLRRKSTAPDSEEHARVKQVRALLHQYGGGPGFPQDTLPK